MSGDKADDPLYIPEIRKVQNSLIEHGVLYVGDCKMASLATRAYVASASSWKYDLLTVVPAKAGIHPST